MSKLSDWLRRWYGTGTPDDRRNPFWRLTERLRVKVLWARYLVDIRIGFKRNNAWRASFRIWNPVTQNFWNGILTFNVYVSKAYVGGFPFLFPRVNLVIRPRHDWWFEAGIGILFDRGEFGVKCVVMNWEKEGKIDASGWSEGSV